MVQFNEHEWDDMRRGQRDEDELSEQDRAIIGGDTCRLEIPFRNVYVLRQVADLLRGYAEMLDVYSRRTDLPPRSILFHLRMEAKMLNGKLRKARGPGRPAKGRQDA